MLFNIEQKQVDKVRAFFRISFFPLLLYSCYGCALFGFHMPYNNYGAFFGTGSGQNWTGNGHKRDREGQKMDQKWTELTDNDYYCKKGA